MQKRKWDVLEGEGNPELTSKRRRGDTADRLSNLSDELILRTLSFVPVETLLICQRISHRFYTLSGDSQLWKSAYYNRFVRPRAARIPGIREQGTPNTSLFYSSRSSRWLEDEHLVRQGKETNWKRQYKLRHKWSRGDCSVKEVTVLARPSVPPTLVRLYEDLVIVADTAYGLRAFEANGTHRLLATSPLCSNKEHDPSQRGASSLTIDASCNKTEVLRIAVGFYNGRFALHSYDRHQRQFTSGLIHASPNSKISAIAFASPYLITLNDPGILSLYCFDTLSSEAYVANDPPRLLQSLRSYTVWPPQTLSIRISSSIIIVSIAYAIPTYQNGWSVGLQELRLTMDGSIILSRLTSGVNHVFKPLAGYQPPEDLQASRVNPMSHPTSLSYTHPYLLACHPDNTLTLYLVHSTDKELTLGSPNRLYGHTSAISGIHIGDRGKAVSVSAVGDEIRVWELEGGITFGSSRKRVSLFTSSVQIRPETPLSTSGESNMLSTTGSDAARIPLHDKGTTTRGWVGFDDEKVIVLRESRAGKQALVVYDFT